MKLLCSGLAMIILPLLSLKIYRENLQVRAVDQYTWTVIDRDALKMHYWYFWMWFLWKIAIKYKQSVTRSLILCDLEKVVNEAQLTDVRC